MSEAAPQGEKPTPPSEAQRVRDASLSAMMLKKGVAELEKKLQASKERAQAKLESIADEKPLTPWIIAAGVLIAANLLWRISFISVAGVALYIWALRHYLRNWTKEKRLEAARAESDAEIAALEKTLQERREELACAERDSAKPSA